MSVYADTSLLVALLSPDALTIRALDRMSRLPLRMVVSDFGRAEYASAIALKLRRGDLRRAAALQALAALDRWLLDRCDLAIMQPADIARATAWLRRLETTLRVPDALHLAMAARLGTSLATFDLGMEAAAEAFDISLAPA